MRKAIAKILFNNNIHIIKDTIHFMIKRRNYLKAFIYNRTLGRRVGNLNYRNFIILTRSRTGSNFLIDMLRAQYAIYAEEEIFDELNGRSVNDILNRIYSHMPKRIKAVGFKIFYYHPFDDNSGKIWNELSNMKELYIIHLKRRNILRAITSKKVAYKTNLWANRKWWNKTLKLENKQVSFTKEELNKGFIETQKWEKDYCEIFKNQKILDVYYEDLVSNPEKTFGRISNFLGVHYLKSETTFKKQNPEKLSELIINYNELKMAFKNTEWSHFFED